MTPADMSTSTSAPDPGFPTREGPPSPRWWWNLPIVLLLGLLFSLGVRSMITKDSRYGWGTFGRQTIYTLRYSWEFEGRSRRYRPGDELRKDAHKLLSSSRQRNTRYGPGAIPVWIRGYCRYMWERRPAGAKAFHCQLRYELDRSRRLKISDQAMVLDFQYPPATDETGGPR